jgi:hypothetical protein
MYFSIIIVAILTIERYGHTLAVSWIYATNLFLQGRGFVAYIDMLIASTPINRGMGKKQACGQPSAI